MTQHKLLILADLHRDNWDCDFRKILSAVPQDFQSPEMVVSAGDLAHQSPRGMGWETALKEIVAALPAGVPLVAVPGNHDYYLGTFDDAVLSAACGASGALFGQKRVSHLGATRILTCTLWSDGLLFSEDHRAEVLRIIQENMNDYHVIKRRGTPEVITAIDTVAAHEDQLAWLEARLAESHEGPTLVITHHGPHPEASLPLDVISAAFVSDLSDVIERWQPDAWVFGHTHRLQSAQLGRTRIHNVGLGYPGEHGLLPLEEILLRGCLEVGDEIRFLMDARNPQPIRLIPLSSSGPAFRDEHDRFFS